MIRITKDNHDALAAAMAKTNGRARQHTFTADDVLAHARIAEEKLESLNIPKKDRSGAKYDVQSGRVLPGAYKAKGWHPVVTTMLNLRRGSRHWFIESSYATDKYPDAKPTRNLKLTEAQDAIAVDRLRRNYTVAVSQKHHLCKLDDAVKCPACNVNFAVPEVA